MEKPSHDHIFFTANFCIVEFPTAKTLTVKSPGASFYMMTLMAWDLTP